MKKIWFQDLDLEKINQFNQNTLVSHLDIKITSFGDDYLEGTMPVESKTHQPFRMLHGGASCVLAESLGSIASNMCIDPIKQIAVGQHIEATHLRSLSEGLVKGVATPLYLGKSSHTWSIKIFNEKNEIVCDSKLIMFIKSRK